MIQIESFIITVPLIVFGLVLAVAGRDIHHTAITALGFIVGFGGISAGYFGPTIATHWQRGDMAGLAGRVVVALVIAVVVGYVTIHLTWSVYRFVVVLPGFFAGGVVGSALMAPVQGTVDYVVILVLAAIGAELLWRLHELFLTVSTAFLGGFLVSAGIAGEAVLDLPMIQQPRLFLADPLALLRESLAVAEVAVVIGLLVFVVGVGIQSRDASPLAVVGNLPVPSRGSSSSGESFSPTSSSKSGTPSSSSSATDTDETATSESGFYEK
jgi:hypothetical protein